MFLYGGTGDGRTSYPALYALDLERGQEQCTRLELPNAPPPRTSGMAAHDAVRGRIVLGFGNDSVVYPDLWSLVLGGL